jgi:hypothetical protein
MIPMGNQWTLGQLIDALKKQPKDAIVSYEFGYFAPTTLASYRGYYEDLALGYVEPEYAKRPTVASLLVELEAAVGATFEGWKGGQYRMDRDTPVYVANPGECPGTGIVGVESIDDGHMEGDGRVLLKTELVDA